MARFKYGVRTDSGYRKGIVEAASEFEAMRVLRSSGGVVEKLRRVREHKGNLRLNEPLRVEPGALAAAASNLSVLLRAGMPTAKAIELTANNSGDKLMKRILGDCADGVRSGISVADSLERSGRIPVAFAELVRAGEETGSLAECFERLAAYYERVHRTRRQIRTATAYPIFLVLLTVVVVGVVMAVLLPTMTGLFDNIDGELPVMTRVLVAASQFVTRFWPLILVGTVQIFAVLIFWAHTKRGGLAFAKLRLRLPFVGRIVRLNAAAQLCETFSTLISSGISAPRALRMAARTLDNKALGAELEFAASELETGRSLAETLREIKYLPPLVAEVAATGEESGALDKAFEQAGEFYDGEAAAESSKALGMLEPALTVAVGLFIAVTVAAIYLPMFEMYNGII